MREMFSPISERIEIPLTQHPISSICVCVSLRLPAAAAGCLWLVSVFVERQILEFSFSPSHRHRELMDNVWQEDY